jgi:hypothetical protein
LILHVSTGKYKGKSSFQEGKNEKTFFTLSQMPDFRAFNKLGNFLMVGKET